MKPMTQAAAGIALALLSMAVAADTKAVEEALARTMPDLKVDSVKDSPMAGVAEVVSGPSVFYVSQDGKFLLKGNLIDVATGVDLTEARAGEARRGAIEKVGAENMIVFAAQPQKHVVTVFTDIDCGYCRKLHAQIAEYQKEGITVRYMFYPRAGHGSDSYHKAVSVWCAKDRQAALTRAKKGESLEAKECDAPVDMHMALANALGINGTPMIITPKGEILPGYVPPKQLAEYLVQEKSGTHGR